jgi:hypothetical protein
MRRVDPTALHDQNKSAAHARLLSVSRAPWATADLPAAAQRRPPGSSGWRGSATTATGDGAPTLHKTSQCAALRQALGGSTSVGCAQAPTPSRGQTMSTDDRTESGRESNLSFQIENLAPSSVTEPPTMRPGSSTSRMRESAVTLLPQPLSPTIARSTLDSATKIPRISRTFILLWLNGGPTL